MLRAARSAVKQSQSIEIAYLINGEVVSVRWLSSRSELARCARGVRSRGRDVRGDGDARRVGDAGGSPGRVPARVFGAVGIGRSRLGRPGRRPRRAPRACLPIGAAIDDDAFSVWRCRRGQPDGDRLPAGGRPGIHRPYRRRARAARARGAGARRRRQVARSAARDRNARRGGVRSGDLRRARAGRRRPRPITAGRLLAPFARRRFPATGAGGAGQHFCAVPVGAPMARPT